MADGREIEELVVGVMELALLLADKFKDGVQASDALEIMSALQTDPRFRLAVTGLSGLKAEAAQYDAAKGVDLGIKVLQYVPKFIELFKK